MDAADANVNRCAYMRRICASIRRVLPLHDDNPTRRPPWLTILLIAVNVYVYFFVQPHGSSREELAFLYEHAAVPCEVLSGEPLDLLEIRTGSCAERSGIFAPPTPFPDKNVWLSVVVSMFLHGSLLHLGGNMLYLWIFGNNVEDHMGPMGFILAYLATGVAAAFAHFAFDPASVVPVVGASGAIAGVMGAYMVLWPGARILTATFFFFIHMIWLPAWLVLGAWFVLQFFTAPDSGIAWMAHVGGFVAGVLVGVVARAAKQPRVPSRHPWEEELGWS
ncbi:MAG: hypothetical protein KatS3mg008_0977 [Acidimicrobiales bacterium]|nr:MAG: hypothetical protein KatS3mg008_0977 [Acidimicrobiales bacterium]